MSHSISGLITALSIALSVLVSGAADIHIGTVSFNGLPVPGATITATQGNQQRLAISDEQGLYTFPNLDNGDWSMQVEMPGFEKITRVVTVQDGAPMSEWQLTMLPLTAIRAELIPAVPIAPTANTSPASPDSERSPENGAASSFANLTPEELNQRAADGVLINGSVNNGATSPFAQLAAFGNNRVGGRPLYNGGVGLILNDSAMDARSFSLTGQDTPRPAYNYAQALISFGGPLRIPRLVRNGPNIFFSYQRTQNRNATTQTGRVPTVRERAGDLSEAGSSGSVMPDRISPQARSLLALYPLPNFEGSSSYNYQIPVIGNTHQDNVQFRLNRSLNAANQLAGNLDYQDTRTDTGNLFGFVDRSEATGVGYSSSWFHRFDPRSSMTLRYQFNRVTARIVPHFANLINVSGEAGIVGNNQEPVNWGPPNLNFVTGITSLTTGVYSFDRNQTNSVSTTGFINRGSHTFTFGGEFRRQQINQFSQQEARGTFRFTGAGTESDFAGFLLGTPDAMSIAFGNPDKYFRGSAYAVHLADDWRMSAGFTLNAGIRWEYEAPLTELYGRLVNLDIAPDFSVASPVIGSTTSLIHPDKTGIQPRISFAWRPLAASSIIVRGGYGIYRNTSVYAAIVAQMAQQFPLSRSASVASTAVYPLTLADGFLAPGGSTRNTFAIDPHFRVGYAHNWQVSVQRDLPAALQMVATYNGARGSRLTRKSLPNTFPQGSVNVCSDCPAGFVYMTSNGRSVRHAAQIQLRRRLQSGFAANLQYTLAKATDNAALATPGQGGASIAQDWLDLEAENGFSSFDQRHLLSVQAQYTTGIGVAGGALLGGWRGRLLREWTIQSQLTIGSGLTLTPIYPLAVTGTGVTGSLRPSTTGSALYETNDGRHINPLAYRAPPPGQWGNAGRNSIRGPEQFSMDVSLGRTFLVSDRLNLNVRLEATNVLNHVTFPDWNTTISSAQFGLPTRANAMRKVQANIRLGF